MAQRIEMLVQKVLGGLRDIKITQKGAWYGQTYDLREHINWLGLRSVFYVLSHNDLGAFFIVARPLEMGRGGDYTAVWFFIPKGIVVPGEELVRLVATAQDDMLSGTDNYDNLDPLLARAWPDDNVVDGRNVRPTEQSAVRFFGTGTGHDYLGPLIMEGIHQSCYLQHPTVFFIDVQARPVLNAQALSQLADLTTVASERYATLLPPVNGTLPPGVAAYVGGQLLTAPVRVSKGTHVQVRLKREGFDDVMLDDHVTADHALLLPAGIVWWRNIPFSAFKVYYKEKPVADHQLLLNGRPLVKGQVLKMKEEELVGVRVQVSRKGCEPFDARFNLLGAPPRIDLRPKGKTSASQATGGDIVIPQQLIKPLAVWSLLLLVAGFALGWFLKPVPKPGPVPAEVVETPRDTVDRAPYLVPPADTVPQEIEEETPTEEHDTVAPTATAADEPQQPSKADEPRTRPDDDFPPPDGDHRQGPPPPGNGNPPPPKPDGDHRPGPPQPPSGNNP